MTFDQANGLDLAEKNYEAYALPGTHIAAAIATSQVEEHDEEAAFFYPSLAATYIQKKKCIFCGGPMQSRSVCPAQDQQCHNCGKKGHLAKVCQSENHKSSKGTAVAVFLLTIFLIIVVSPRSLSQASVIISVCGQNLLALIIYSGSSDSLINERAIRKLNLHNHLS